VTGLAVGRHASPNHGERAAGKPVDMLILHYTGMASEEGALGWLCNPASNVSCHYFVFGDGRIVQLVDEDRRAWHAGKSEWAGESDINARSIGIEIANPGHEFGYRPFPDAQIAAVIALCRDILGRRPIPPRHVLAHSDVAPLRKADPGEVFPWTALADAGVGMWVPPEPIGSDRPLREGDAGPGVRRLKEQLHAYGYAAGAGERYDETCAAVVSAFQRHFRPALFDGAADASTVVTLERLVAALRQ
jgi:N-acetylmuramoyl-L-alanine amidase